MQSPRARSADINIGISFTELCEAKSRAEALSAELEEVNSMKPKFLGVTAEVARLEEALASMEKDLCEKGDALREKDEEISQVNQLLEGERQSGRQLKEEAKIQGGEVEEQLSNMTLKGMKPGERLTDCKRG